VRSSWAVAERYFQRMDVSLLPHRVESGASSCWNERHTLFSQLVFLEQLDEEEAGVSFWTEVAVWMQDRKVVLHREGEQHTGAAADGSWDVWQDEVSLETDIPSDAPCSAVGVHIQVEVEDRGEEVDDSTS